MMLKLLFSYKVLLVLLCIVFICSCCTKKMCNDVSINSIHFKNFNIDEVDTVLVYSYERNSNYQVFLNANTEIAQYWETDSTYRIYFSEMQSMSNDYKIIVKKINQTFYVNEFEFNENACNTCFIARPKSDYYHTLAS